MSHVLIVILSYFILQITKSERGNDVQQNTVTNSVDRCVVIRADTFAGDELHTDIC